MRIQTVSSLETSLSGTLVDAVNISGILKKNTAHSWWRVNYIFSGDCDIIALGERRENAGNSA